MHGGEAYMVEEVDQSGNVLSIWKTSSSPEGVKNLHQEIEGIHWYNSQNKNNIEVAVEKETLHYISLKYKFISGEKAVFQNGYWLNRKWISLAIEHYCEVWKWSSENNDGLYPLHGDFSLDNIIFIDDGPVILDWEHFSMNVAPLGFDGLYLMFEALWFETGNKNPKPQTLAHLASMISLMRNRNCLDNRYKANPLSQIIQFILKHSSLWGTQLKQYRNKLPILLFKENVVENIDKEITILIESVD